MNYVSRAKGILGRSMPRPDVRLAGWYPTIVEELARGLRQMERDARRKAIREAASAVGGWTGPENTAENAALVSAICRSARRHVQALERLPRLGRKR